MERAELARRLGGLPGEIRPGRVVIDEADADGFARVFADAVASDAEIFLANPSWGATERAQFSALLKAPPSASRQGWLMIPTGGSSGVMKLARHDSETLAAAVEGFRRHFELRQVNALNLLPLYHVSGLMAWLRCVVSGGQHVAADWKAVAAGQLPRLPAGEWVTSLVPTQLERLLQDERSTGWLRQFRVVFVGGGPSWAALVRTARAQRVPIALTYGMTETAAMVAGLRPHEEPAGLHDCGSPLPHARLRITAEGEIAVGGGSVFRGYFPSTGEADEFVTQDAGEIRGGRLHVLGRLDGVIITGGEKVQPMEVESELRATGEFSDVVVLGLPHAEWGQEVIAAYPGSSNPNLDRVRRAMRDALAPHKQPKRYVPVHPWPASTHGKVNRTSLLATVQLLARAS